MATVLTTVAVALSTRYSYSSGYILLFMLVAVAALSVVVVEAVASKVAREK
jgi:hypothetical protein